MNPYLIGFLVSGALLIAYSRYRRRVSNMEARIRDAEDPSTVVPDNFLVTYLRKQLRADMSLAELVDAFARMSAMPLPGGKDLLLYEVGTFGFSGEKRLYFSLVRQFPTGKEDEYYQVHLMVEYPHSPVASLLYESQWSDELEGDFFDYVRSSKAFLALQKLPYHKYEIQLEET